MLTHQPISALALFWLGGWVGNFTTSSAKQSAVMGMSQGIIKSHTSNLMPVGTRFAAFEWYMLYNGGCGHGEQGLKTTSIVVGYRIVIPPAEECSKSWMLGIVGEIYQVPQGDGINTKLSCGIASAGDNSMSIQRDKSVVYYSLAFGILVALTQSACWQQNNPMSAWWHLFGTSHQTFGFFNSPAPIWGHANSDLQSILRTQIHVPKLAHSHTDSPMPYSTKVKDHIRQKCLEMKNASELMEQAEESCKKISERIMCMAKQSERQHRQMVHLSVLEASLTLLREGNTILRRRLQVQEELMATQEQKLDNVLAKIEVQIGVTVREARNIFPKTLNTRSTESYYFPLNDFQQACDKCPTGDMCMVIYQAGSWQKLALKTQRKAYKRPEFVPSSANKMPDSANEGAKMQPKVTSAGRWTQKAHINAENIGKGYTVYDPRQPRQRIGAITKVNLRQHGEVDGGSDIGGSKHQMAELEEITAKVAKLELAMKASRPRNSKPLTCPSNKWVSDLRKGGFRKSEKGKDKANAAEDNPDPPETANIANEVVSQLAMEQIHAYL
ncbi:hypothetical protein BDN67DRAFT_981847 [Paxillus ammoniavirescens]|nr:hypothetical protein BDN67DRAFT_981847 [Paxillus ammoniavirescens]